MSDKIYLGDGVYADWDGFHLVLTTESIEVTNTIYLTDDVWASLVDYIEHLKSKAKGAL